MIERQLCQAALAWLSITKATLVFPCYIKARSYSWAQAGHRLAIRKPVKFIRMIIAKSNYV